MKRTRTKQFLCFSVITIFQFFWMQVGFADEDRQDSEAKNIERGARRKHVTEKNQSLTTQQNRVVDNAVLPRVDEKLVPGGNTKILSVIPYKSIKLTGSSVINDEEVQKIVQETVADAYVSIAQLNSIRHKLSTIYLERGYVNSGVVITDKEIENGHIELQAIEGQLSDIQIEGLTSLKSSYVRNSFNDTVRMPLNVNNLKNALAALNDGRLIEKVNAQLVAGEGLGDSALKMRVKEGKRNYLRSSIDNHRSPSVGENRFSLEYENLSLVGIGDTFNGGLSLTNGSKSVHLLYKLPILQFGRNIGASYSLANSDVIEEPFNQIDISSDYEYRNVFYERQLKLGGSNSMMYRFDFDYKRSVSKVLGAYTSLAPGAVDGVSKVSVIAVSAQWMRQESHQIVLVSSQFRLGVKLLGATSHADDQPDSNFKSGQLQFQYSRRFTAIPSQVLVRTAGQYSLDPLMGMEKFTIGGINSVRGYRENQYVRDNGLFASVEYKLPVFFLMGELTQNKLWASTFIDSGTVWDKNSTRLALSKRTITSAGLGVEWWPLSGMKLNLIWAKAFDNIPDPGEKTLQDIGVHAQLSYSIGF